MMGVTNDSRIKWVDHVKVIACILVVLGHFFQSMTKAGILPANALYQWFNQTIYSFHVPLFFICSGFLYQRYSCINNRNAWIQNVRKKALALGVPYIAFSSATWLLKTVFSGDVNDEIGSLGDTLFLHPTAPYWYLYILFCIFLITPTFRNVGAARIGFIIALIIRIIAWIIGDVDIYAFGTLGYLIWFVSGMCIETLDIRLTGRIRLAIISGGIFLLLSVVIYRLGIDQDVPMFLIGVLACVSIILLAAEYQDQLGQWQFMRLLARYTMPIYLMHTLFAAPMRTLLVKCGIMSPPVHVVAGILVSILGPITAAVVMRRLKYPEFLLYPNKFIRL